VTLIRIEGAYARSFKPTIHKKNKIKRGTFLRIEGHLCELKDTYAQVTLMRIEGSYATLVISQFADYRSFERERERELKYIKQLLRNNFYLFL